MTPQAAASTDVFITGGTGYLGRRLITELLGRGHRVRALVRERSRSRVPSGCFAVVGDALKGQSYAHLVRPGDTFVHLVGVAHPSPAKAKQFLEVDLVSIREAVPVAVAAGVSHFVYVSVAQPAPVMRAFQAVRAEGEAIIRQSGVRATIVRPWYVIGPGHYWPLAIAPFYWIAERLPATRDTARRLGLVTVDQMTRALVAAVELPSREVRIVGAPQIRSGINS